MAWTKIDGRRIIAEEDMQDLVDHLPDRLWASGIVLHNTALPSLAQWHKSAEDDRKKGLLPGSTRFRNLERYFRVDRGWPSGPHLFIDDLAWWIFTPLTAKGTHSPSWNGTKIGIEMIADFSKEDDDSGPGLEVKKKAVAFMAMLCTKYGWDPETAIKLHKEDPRTTHDCPGKDIQKAEIIDLVQAYMGHAGEHPEKLPIGAVEEAKPGVPHTVNTVGDTLNMRDKASASGKLIMILPHKAKVQVISKSKNGSTEWAYVETAGKNGWVAARYLKEG